MIVKCGWIPFLIPYFLMDTIKLGTPSLNSFGFHCFLYSFFTCN